MENNHRYYLAYCGSDMMADQMAARAPGARIVGTALINGWQLIFQHYANLRATPGAVTPAVVWELTEKAEEKLDGAKWVPDLFVKKEFQVTMKPLDDGEPMELTAMTYILNNKDTQATYGPSDSYYCDMVSGYKKFSFDMVIMNRAIDECNERSRKAMEMRHEWQRSTQMSEIKTDENLKPCPFCGGKAEVVKKFVERGVCPRVYETCYEVCCNDKDCRCGTNHTEWHHTSPEEAIADWNRRATQ